MAKRGDNIYKRKDGRYEGRYIKGRREDGKPLFGYVYAYTYADAKNALDLTKAEMSPKKPLNIIGDGSLGDFIYYWLEEVVKKRVKPSTYYQYHNRTRRHIIPALGGVAVYSLSFKAISDFENALIYKGLNEATITSIVNLLGSMLKDAKNLRLIESNPFDKINTEQQKKFEKIVSYSL